MEFEYFDDYSVEGEDPRAFRWGVTIPISTFSSCDYDVVDKNLQVIVENFLVKLFGLYSTYFEMPNFLLDRVIINVNFVK